VSIFELEQSGHPGKAANDETAGGYAFPLSPAQERIWRADQARPGNPAYNAAFRWRLEGPVDADVLEHAFNEIVRRHEILRATVSQSNGLPQQVIRTSLRLRLQLTDLRSVPETNRAAEADRICAEEAARSFDLAKGPLIRIRLLQLQDQQYILALSLHQIVCDGWSIRVIMEELAQLYPAFAARKESPLAELNLQYPDYVVWQRELAEAGQFNDQLSYWTSKLKGYQRIEVEADFPRPVERSIKSSILSMQLPRELTDKLKQFSDREGGTMFITTLAACMVLLHRRTGKRDISIGSPIARRDRADVEGLVGLFYNEMVYRVEITDNLLFSELLSLVRDTVMEGFANQEVPFEHIVKSLTVSGQPAPEPFYVINFICQRAFGGSSRSVFGSTGVQATPIPSVPQGALHDLNFFMIEREDGWRISLEFNTDLYRASTAQHLLDDFRALLEQIPSDPGRRISEFALPEVSENSSEDSEKVASKTSTPAEGSDNPEEPELYALPASLSQERFWAFAKLDPDNAAFNMPAVLRLSGPLSVEALEKSLQRLIDRHEILRTKFEERNGVLTQVISRNGNFSLATSDLAALPVDQRESRLAQLVREAARQPFDLVQGPLIRAHLFRLHDLDHVLIVTVHHIISDGWSQNVIQRELWSAYKAFADRGEPQDEPLQIQFGDFAVWQREWQDSDEANAHRKYWMARLSGTLPIIDFPLDRTPVSRRIEGALETLVFPASLIQEFKSFCKAESVTPFMLTLACFAILLSEYANQDDLVIGSPVANRRPETEALIGPFAAPVALRLDLSGNPTLREILQAARQVTIDGLSHAEYPFELLAKDLKVRSRNGRNPLFQFYFLYQSAFLQNRELPGLTIAPVPTFSIGTPFELQLAVIERDDSVYANLEYSPDLFNPSTIRQILNYYESLLRAIIADPNRRIADLDKPAGRRAVPRPLQAMPERAAFTPPRDEYETLLVEIWREVFGEPKVGIYDDFFALGGNSLRAAEFVSRLERESGITIDLSTLIVRPTIAKLSEYIQLQETDSLIIPLRATGTTPPLFCIHPGGGHLFHYLDLVRELPRNQVIYGLRPPDVDSLRHVRSVKQLAAMYIDEIQKIQSHGPYQLCGMSFGGLVAWEIASQLIGRESTVSLLALFDTSNPASRPHRPPSIYALSWINFFARQYNKYALKLTRGSVGEVISSLIFSSRIAARTFVWRSVRRVCKLLHLPIPRGMHTMLDTFVALNHSYKPPLFTGQLVLFRAEDRSASVDSDPTLGWGEMAQGGVTIHSVPGDHITMMRPPNVLHLARHLNDYLAKTSKVGT
jgi:non-ribosomal peptide synthetase component F/thioesterase domain-containing protein/aryl carrier-like protein